MSFECLLLTGTFIRLSCLNMYVYFYIYVSIYFSIIHIRKYVEKYLTSVTKVISNEYNL